LTLGFPGECSSTAGVPASDVILDRGDALFDRAECSSTDRLARNQAKPDLNLIDPRRSDRCAVDGDVGIVGQPVAHFGSEVCAKVVHHDVTSQLLSSRGPSPRRYITAAAAA